MKPKVVERAATGLVVWAVPGSTFEIMWAGPGSHLMFGHPRVAGGMVFPIAHPTANAAYATLRDATAAVAAFLAVETGS